MDSWKKLGLRPSLVNFSSCAEQKVPLLSYQPMTWKYLIPAWKLLADLTASLCVPSPDTRNDKLIGAATLHITLTRQVFIIHQLGKKTAHIYNPLY